MNIDGLRPGRELDAIVGERVVGLRMVNHKTATYDPTPEDMLMGHFADVPRYSTDDGAAWHILMHCFGGFVTVARSVRGNQDFMVAIVGDPKHVAYGQTFALAACRAALKAVTETTILE